MRTQPNPANAAGDDPVHLKQALLGLLVIDHPGLWSTTELTRSLTSSAQIADGGDLPTHDTEDAIERLYAAGLIHRIGGYVFAARAAHQAERINA